MAERKELPKPSQADELLEERSADVAELGINSPKNVSVILGPRST